MKGGAVFCAGLMVFVVSIVWILFGVGNPDWNGISPGHFAADGVTYIWSVVLQPPLWWFMALGGQWVVALGLVLWGVTRS
jgi:hypothetical protein